MQKAGRQGSRTLADRWSGRRPQSLSGLNLRGVFGAGLLLRLAKSIAAAPAPMPIPMAAAVLGCLRASSITGLASLVASSLLLGAAFSEGASSPLELT